jgi:hypothetical protein
MMTQDLQHHLDGLRRALTRARDHGAPEHIITQYESEVARVERLLAEGGAKDPEPIPPEQRHADSVLGIALRKKMPAQKDPVAEAWERRIRELVEAGAEPDIWPEELRSYVSDAPATVSETPGLPLSIPSVPSGLPPEEAREREHRALLAIWRRWVETLKRGLKLRRKRRAALRRLAAERGEDPEVTKRWLAHIGLHSAVRMLDEPTEDRIGSGPASGQPKNVAGQIEPVIPAEEPILAQLVWLAQKAKAQAVTFLDTLAPAPETEGREGDVDPDTQASTRPTALDAIIAEEDRQRLRDRLYAAAVGKEAEKLERFFHYYFLDEEEGYSYREALRAAGSDLGVSEGTVENIVRSVIRRVKRLLRDGPGEDHT